MDEVDIEYVPDDNTRVLKLQGGEDDVVDFVPFSQIDALNAQPGIKAMDFPIQQTTIRHPERHQAAAERHQRPPGAELRDGQGRDHQVGLLRPGPAHERADPAGHVR